MSASSLDEALLRVGDRWSLHVVATLLDGPLRFGQIQDSLPGVSPNILTARLRHLGEGGVIVARLYSERPKRFTYELTQSGVGLAEVIEALSAWGSALDGAGSLLAEGTSSDQPTTGAAEDEIRFL